jgi:hypothetical protein
MWEEHIMELVTEAVYSPFYSMLTLPESPACDTNNLTIYRFYVEK